MFFRSLIISLALMASAAHASTNCVAGSGHDYQVGPNAGQLTAPSQVPWNALVAGDSVRFFYSPNAYKIGAKFAINSSGVTVCGVRGPNGERPVLDGSGATTSPNTNYGRDSATVDNKSLSLTWIGPKGTDVGVRKPANITISGLKFVHARPGYVFDGAQAYAGFVAAIRLDPGDNVVITDNEFDDISQAFYSRSFDGGDAVVSVATKFTYNRVTNWGLPGDDHEHGSYTESQGMLYEGNWFGPPIANAGGNPIKDRSSGTIVRYNVTNGGSYCADLVEAEDFSNTATSDPAYRTTLFYGNVCRMPQLGLHYGGDHAGSEANYRKGTLYAYSNTFDMQGSPGEGVTYLFRISTTDEHVEAFNNIYYGPPTQVGCDPVRDCTMYVSLRSTQDVAAGYTSGGTLNLGAGFDVPGCAPPGPVCDGDPYHAVAGPLSGVANLVVNAAKPYDANLVPVVAGKADGNAQAPLAAVASHPVTMQPDINGVVTARASVADLGAIESGGVAPPPTCPSMPPVASQDVTCPAGTTGTWTQTHGWDAAAYPVCWVAQTWQPTTPPANRCPPIPPPPTRLIVTIKQGSTVTHTFQADATTNKVDAILVPRVGTVPLHWRASQGTDVFNFPNSNVLSWSQQQVTSIKATH